MAKVTESVEVDFDAVLAKNPTPATVGFCDWFLENTSVVFTKIQEQAFRDGVKAGGALGGVYAKSPERLAAREASRTARAAKASEPKPAKAAKAKAAAKPKPKPAAATDLI
jgi:cell division septation protein DedD